MALIKHDIADELARHAIVLDFGDLNRQAELILADAHARAQAILHDARQEAQRLIDSAEEVGHARGYEEGLAEGLEQGLSDGHDKAFGEHARAFEVVTESWKNALYHWDVYRNEMLLEAREDILGFAFAVAAKIVRRLVQLDPSLVETQLEEALKLLSAPSALSLVIHPEDRCLVERALPAMTQHIARSQHVAIEEDPSVERGGCIIRTAGGTVDATIEKQLERIAAILIPHELAQPSPVPSPLTGDRGGDLSASQKLAPKSLLKADEQLPEPDQSPGELRDPEDSST